MGCTKLFMEQDLSCYDGHRKYYQQLVLVNLEDVNEVVYNVDDNNHSIAFNLNENTTGYRYMGNENASVYSASFSKSTRKGQPLYTHTVRLPIVGVGTTTKLILKQLDLSDYFAAIQFRDGTIEIYGFENGLTTQDYTFEAQNGMGGVEIVLESKHEEEHPPYIYLGGEDNYNNKFAGIGELLGGDFNGDFNNDFYIFEI